MNEIVYKSLKRCESRFAEIDKISLSNFQKVLEAFSKNKVSLMHFNGTSGYGLGDVGKETLCDIMADIFGAEKAIVSPHIASGTHAISLALFGVLRPNDTVVGYRGDLRFA